MPRVTRPRALLLLSRHRAAARNLTALVLAVLVGAAASALQLAGAASSPLSTAGPIPSAFPFSDDDIKARKVTVSQVLALYRKAYTPSRSISATETRSRALCSSLSTSARARGWPDET